MNDNLHVRATDQPAPGTELAGYRIEELTGRGGMGEVYRAHDPRLDRNVALKVLAPRFAENEDFRDRLLRESRLAASLDHPNVIPVYDAGEVDGRLYLAMRYVEGTDLRRILLEEGTLAPERAVALAAQMADALDAAHERGLVHRDVKPSNVLVDRRGHAYLADFGLTQSVSDRGPTDGSLMGTIDYLAPEQLRGETVDGRADQYALGCLLFECLTGTLPYQGRSDLATMFAHLEEPVPSASTRRAGIPQAVDGVLARAMAKEPAERFGTCRELVDEARAALGLETPRHRGLRLAIAAMAVAVLAAAALVSALLLTRDASPVSTSGSLIRIDPQTGAVTAHYRVSAHPGVITTSAGRVWLGDFLEGALWRLEPRSGELKRVPPAGEPRDLASLDGKVYVASDGAEPFTGTIARYDAVTGNREGGLNLVACAVAAGEGTLWSCGIPNVNRLSTDAGTLRVLQTIVLPRRAVYSVETTRIVQRDAAIGFGSVWVVGDAADRRLWRVDLSSGRVLATIELRSIPRTVATGEGAVWVSAPLDDRVLRVDPQTNRIVATIATGRGTSGVAAGAGSVWVTNMIDGTVSRIDPRTSSVTDEIEVGGRPREVAVGAGGVWVGADAR
jgi:YVTN family beta-propeller protein